MAYMLGLMHSKLVDAMEATQQTISALEAKAGIGAPQKSTTAQRTPSMAEAMALCSGSASSVAEETEMAPAAGLPGSSQGKNNTKPCKDCGEATLVSSRAREVLCDDCQAIKYPHRQERPHVVKSLIQSLQALPKDKIPDLVNGLPNQAQDALRKAMIQQKLMKKKVAFGGTTAVEIPTVDSLQYQREAYQADINDYAVELQVQSVLQRWQEIHDTLHGQTNEEITVTGPEELATLRKRCLVLEQGPCKRCKVQHTADGSS